MKYDLTVGTGIRLESQVRAGRLRFSLTSVGKEGGEFLLPGTDGEGSVTVNVGGVPPFISP